MPLSNEVAPCAFCLREAADEINEETGEPVGIANVVLTEITPTSRTCVKCLQRFCPDHASPVDQVDCCYACLPFEAIAEMKTPLISQTEEGNHVLRKGYRLVPTGIGYKTLPAAIADMSNEQLADYIAEKAKQIHQIEKQRDFLRVAQSTAKLEQSERDQTALRALRGYKLPYKPQTGIKITGTKATNGGAKGVSMPVGFSLADFLKFASDKLKAEKSKASPAVASRGDMSKAPEGSVKPSVAGAPRGGVIGATPPTPPKASPEEIQEKIREAEIEAILDGGDVIAEAVKEDKK